MKLFMVISGILLIVGVASLPDGYYLFLRILIPLASIVVIINEFKSKFNLWVLIFAAIAVLFNPFIPFEFEDFLTKALIFMASGFIFILKASVPEKHLKI